MFQLIQNILELIMFFLPNITILLYLILTILAFIAPNQHPIIYKLRITILISFILNLLFIGILNYGFYIDANANKLNSNILSILNILCIIIVPIHFLILKLKNKFL